MRTIKNLSHQHYCSLLVRQSFHKCKYLWSVRGKGVGSSLAQRRFIHIYNQIRSELNFYLVKKKKKNVTLTIYKNIVKQFVHITLLMVLMTTICNQFLGQLDKEVQHLLKKKIQNKGCDNQTSQLPTLLLVRLSFMIFINLYC